MAIEHPQRYLILLLFELRFDGGSQKNCGTIAAHKTEMNFCVRSIVVQGAFFEHLCSIFREMRFPPKTIFFKPIFMSSLIPFWLRINHIENRTNHTFTNRNECAGIWTDLRRNRLILQDRKLWFSVRQTCNVNMHRTDRKNANNLEILTNEYGNECR